MATIIQCPECAKSLRLNQAAEGMRVRCPACQHRFVVAEPEEPEFVEPIDEEPAPKRSSQIRRSRNEVDADEEAPRRPRRRVEEEDDEDDEPRRSERSRTSKRDRESREITYSSRPLIYGIASCLTSCAPVIGALLGTMALVKANEEIDNLPRSNRANDARKNLQIAKILGIIGICLSVILLIVGLTLKLVYWTDSVPASKPAPVVPGLPVPGGPGFPAANPRPGVPNVQPVQPAPTTPPQFQAEPAYRPSFVFGGKSGSGGTAWITKAPSGKLLALTAAHVLDRVEWLTLQSTSLATMSGRRIVEIRGKAAYFGHSFTDPAPLEVGGLPHTSEDIALWILPATAPVQPLELSDHEPTENEWVWIVGQEPGKKLNYYLAKVVKVGGGTFALQQQRPIETNGFSGGPILTTTGKVIGTTLGATDQKVVIGTTVTSIRNRIAGF